MTFLDAIGYPQSYRPDVTTPCGLVLDCWMSSLTVIPSSEALATRMFNYQHVSHLPSLFTNSSRGLTAIPSSSLPPSLPFFHPRLTPSIPPPKFPPPPPPRPIPLRYRPLGPRLRYIPTLNPTSDKLLTRARWRTFRDRRTDVEVVDPASFISFIFHSCLLHQGRKNTVAELPPGYTSDTLRKV